MKQLFWPFMAAILPVLISNPVRSESESSPQDLKVEVNLQKDHSNISNKNSPRDLGPKSLEELVQELMAYNPELSGLMEKIQGYKNRIPQAGALEDPRFEFALRNFQVQNFDPNADFMSGFEFGLRQKVPWPGKLGLRKKIATSQFDQEREEYVERLNQLVAKFKKGYFEYLFVDKAVAIYESSLSRLRGLLPVLEAKYSAGETPQQDILKNKVEISSLENTLIELREREKILNARLITLLYRPAGSELQIKNRTFSLPPLELALAEVREITLENRPWLKKSQLQIEASEFQTQLAKKELLPDFDFGAGYMLRTNKHDNPNDNQDMITLGFSLNLPIYAGKKQKQGVQEAVHMKKMEEFQKAATEQEALFEVEKLYHELRQLRSQIGLLKRQTIPQSTAAVKSSQINYQAEETDFLNVLTNEINLLNYRLQEVQLQYEYEKRVAELEVATGLPIEVLNQISKKEEKKDEAI